MDDLISRWAAIDALTDTNLKRNLDSLCDGDMNRTRRAAQRVIARLPKIFHITFDIYGGGNYMNIRGLNNLIQKFKELSMANKSADTYLMGGRIVHKNDISEALTYLKDYRDMLNSRKRELDDNPNWRAGHPEEYGLCG